MIYIELDNNLLSQYMKAKDRSKAKQYLYYDMVKKSEKLRIDINKEQDPFRMLDKALLCIYFLTGDEMFYVQNRDKLIKIIASWDRK